MTPEMALLLLGVITLTEWALWLWRKLSPGSGPVFA